MARRKALVYLGYVAFALLAFLASLYATFPVDALGQRVAHEIQRQSGGAWSLQFGAASTYRLSGIALDDVTLKRANPDGAPLQVHVDALRARLRLLPLLLWRKSIDATVVTGDGSVAVRVTPHAKGGLDAAAKFDRFDLSRPPLLALFVGLPGAGTVSGSIEASFDDDPSKGTGSADLTIDNAGVGPGTVAGFTLPTIGLGKLALGLEIKDAKARITQFKQSGGNIGLAARGGVQLRQPWQASGVDACLQFRADPNFLNENPKIRTVLQLAEVQLRKDDQGFLHLPLLGTLMGPRVAGGLCH